MRSGSPSRIQRRQTGDAPRDLPPDTLKTRGDAAAVTSKAKLTVQSSARFRRTTPAPLLESGHGQPRRRRKRRIPVRSRMQVWAPACTRDALVATCTTGRLVGNPGVMSGRSADLLCRGCGSRRCACCRLIPYDLQARPTSLPVWTTSTSNAALPVVREAKDSAP